MHCKIKIAHDVKYYKRKTHWCVRGVSFGHIHIGKFKVIQVTVPPLVIMLIISVHHIVVFLGYNREQYYDTHLHCVPAKGCFP